MYPVIALVLIITIVVLAALAESFGSDSRDFERRTTPGDLR
jgi:FlaG/FlaF family flagellin (archaellin)